MTFRVTVNAPSPPSMTYHLSPIWKYLIFSRAWSPNHPLCTSYLRHLWSLALMFSPTLLHTWPTCFPSCFKSALVTPLLKKPYLDPGNLSNFRPISNLNNISKILERLFLTRIMNHITSSPNFSHYQSAYREGHSTETALTSILDNIFSSIEPASLYALTSVQPSTL